MNPSNVPSQSLERKFLLLLGGLIATVFLSTCRSPSPPSPTESLDAGDFQLSDVPFEDSVLLIVGEEQIEALNLSTQFLSRLPFENLPWPELDLTPDRGISPEGWLAVRALGPNGEEDQLHLQLINALDGLALVPIPLLSDSLARSLLAEDGLHLKGEDVSFMLLGGWAAPRWSPDGKKLAFMAARDGGSSDLYLYHLEEGSIERLTNEPGQANVIGWSPDSTTVIYTVGVDFEPFLYDALDLRSHHIFSGEDQSLFDPVGWQGVHIFGWHSNHEFIFGLYDTEQRGYYDLFLANTQTGETQNTFVGMIEDAAVEPYSGKYALILHDDPEWGSGVFIGSFITMELDRVIDWGMSERWHGLEWVESEGRYVVASAVGALLFDSARQQLDAFREEDCPPNPSPDGAWILFGGCEGTGDFGNLRLYQRWEAPAKTLSDEMIKAQIWRSDGSQVVYLTLDGKLYVHPIPSGEPRLVWNGEALRIEVIQPAAARAVAKATLQAAPTSTYWSTSTPTQTPTRAPTPTSETPEKLAPLQPGEPLLFDQLHMVDTRTGWGVAARNTEYDLRRTYHLLRTQDGGDTWWEVTPPELVKPSQADTLFLYGDFLDDQHAWVISNSLSVTKPMLVWRTSDGGQTWSAARLRTRYSTAEAGPKIHFVDEQHGWLFLVYFLGAGSYDVDIFRTFDGGVTWENVLLSNYPFSIVRDLDFIGQGTGWLVSGHGGGFVPAFYLEMTNDGGQTWTEVTLESELEPSGLEGFCDIQDPNIISYSQGEITRRCEIYVDGIPRYRYYLGTTEDAGQTWKYIEIPGKPYRLDASYQWAVESSILPPNLPPEPTVIYRSVDGGASWQEFSRVDWRGDLYFSTFRHGWALSEGHLLRTSDGAATWESVAARLVNPPKHSVDTTDWVWLEASSDPINAFSITGLELLSEYAADSPVSLAMNDRALYVGTARGRVAVWPKATLFPRALPELRISEGWIYDLDTSMDLSGFWAVSEDGHAYRYADLFYDLLQQVPTTYRELSGVSLADAGVLISGSEGRIELWDWSEETSWEWALKSSFEGHQGWVWDVDSAPNEQLYASGGSDTTVRLWNAPDGSTMGILAGHTSTVTKVRFSPDSQYIASASRDGTVRIWEVETGDELVILQGHLDWVLDLTFSPDGSLLASVDAAGKVILWNTRSGALLSSWQAHMGASRGVVFSPDGSLLITTGDDDLVKLWGIGA